MTSKFGNVTVGIHGQELPKFQDNSQTKEYWKFSKTFTHDPSQVSALEMKENHKWWAKNDLMKLADVRDEQAPIDQFKASYTKQFPKNTVVDKIQTINHWKQSESDAKDI